MFATIGNVGNLDDMHIVCVGVIKRLISWWMKGHRNSGQGPGLPAFPFESFLGKQTSGQKWKISVAACMYPYVNEMDENESGSVRR